MKKGSTLKKWFIACAVASATFIGFSGFVHAEDAPAAAPKVEAPAAGGGQLAITDASATKTVEGPHMSFKSIVFGSVSGAFIWLLLISSSIAGGALVVDSFLTISEKKIVPALLVSGVREAMEQGDMLKAMKRCEEMPGGQLRSRAEERGGRVE